MSRHISRLSKLYEPATEPVPLKQASRRALQRMDTTALNIGVAIRSESQLVEGSLINVSASGCCVRVSGDAAGAFSISEVVQVTISLSTQDLPCDSEIVAFDGAEYMLDVRLRFRALDPQVHRTLLLWINKLAHQEFQKRYSRE